MVSYQEHQSNQTKLEHLKAQREKLDKEIKELQRKVDDFNAPTFDRSKVWRDGW